MDGRADVEYVLGLKMLPDGLPELKSLEVQLDVLLVVQVEDSLSFAGRHIALSKRSYRFMEDQSDFGGAAVNNTGLSRKKIAPDVCPLARSHHSHAGPPARSRYGPGWPSRLAPVFNLQAFDLLKMLYVVCDKR